MSISALSSNVRSSSDYPEETLKLAKKVSARFPDADLVLALDLEGNIISNQNQAQLQMELDLLGPVSEHICTKHPPENYRSKVYPAIEQALASGQSRAKVLRFGPEGSIVSTELSLVLCRDANGNPFGLVAVYEDLKNITSTIRTCSDIDDIVSLSPNIIFLWKNNSIPEFITQNVSQLGYSPEDFYSNAKVLFDLVCPEDQDSFAEITELNPGQNNASNTGQIRITCANGATRWMRITAILSKDPKNGETTRKILLEDITENKNIQNQLSANQVLFKDLFNIINDGIIITDGELNILQSNKRIRKLLGMEKNEINGNRVGTILGQRTEETANAVLQSGLEQSVFSTYSFAPGRKLKTTISELKNHTGPPNGLAIHIRDIASSEESQNTLHDIIRELEILNNVISEGNRAENMDSYLEVILKDIIEWTGLECGCIMLKDSTSSNLVLRAHIGTGCNFPQPCKNTIIDTQLLKPVLRQFKPAIIDEVEFAEDMKAYAFPLHTKDRVLGALILGTAKDFCFSQNQMDFFVSLGNEAGNVLSRLFAEQASVKAQKLAEKNSQIKSQFLANVSHEIRTPLNAVIGFSEMLMNMVFEKTQEDYVRTIRDSGHVLLTLVNDLLDISKIESGKINLEQIGFDMEKLINDVISMAQNRTQSDEIKIECIYPGNLPKDFVGDPTRIRQIFLNLLNNAIKFTPRGNIVVRMFPEVEKNEEDGTINVRFSVKDNGIGIPKDKQSSVFDAFVQASASTSRMFGGTGLGLAITRDLVEMMGGNIKVTSQKGKGSEFVFTLRLATNINGKSLMPAEKLKNLRTLCFEPQASKDVAYTLEDAGIPVVFSTSDAEQCAQWLSDSANTAPDLVVCHVSPEMEVTEVIKLLKTQPKFKNTRIFTVVENSQMQNRFLGMGVDAVEGPDSNLALGIRKLYGKNLGMPHNTPPAEPGEKGAIKVLVAEDNPLNQKLILALLKHLGCKADLAINGQEAIDKLRQDASSYNLCLMDIQMPVIDGLSATKIIRNEIKSSIPIIAVTAAAMKNDRDKCLQAGMNDYIPKPINQIILKEKIKAWMSK